MDKVHELFIVAHPDDEVIGAGGHFARLRAPAFVHVTDGAPAGSPPGMAALRRAEFARVLELAGIAPDRAAGLGFADQTAALHLGELTRMIAAIVAGLQPGFIYTHAYEGGHPDHDAVAFAVQQACGAESVIEFTSYHARDGQMTVGEFLPGGTITLTVQLNPEQCARKRAYFDCYGSQADMLRHFPIRQERFRLAPRYDFRRRPHPGRLFYEDHDWGLTADQWLALTEEALACHA